MKAGTVSTCPVLNMAPCHMPHNSAQRTVKSPSWLVVLVYATLS